MIAETLSLFSKTFLKQVIYENSFLLIDVWSILHFIFFFLVGFFLKLPFRVVFIGMLLFEGFEKFLSTTTPFFHESLKDTFTDILVNTLGFIVGALL